MPTISHSALSGNDLHEPLGVATATANQVYVSDGAGSGEWKTLPFGWAFYQDNATEQTFTTTAAKLSINGSGTLTEESYLPQGVTSLWDTTNDKILPHELGDGYDISLDLPITSTSFSAGELTLEFDISGTSSPTTVVLSRYEGMDKTPPYTISVGLPLVALTSTTVTNGIQIFASTDDGSVGITAPSILIKRDFGGSFNV